MKKLVLFMTMAAAVAFTSCSKDDDDNSDPIVGTWVAESSTTFDGQEETISKDTWIFSSNGTGVHTESQNGDQTSSQDFDWSRAEDIYTLTAEGTEGTGTFTIGETAGQTTLMSNGFPIAVKE